jgi:hypothetical protein
MSATRDQNQATTFIYSNFYELYRNQKGLKTETSVTSGVLLKAGTVRSVTAEDAKALGSWSRAEDLHHGKKSLAQQLAELRQARKRLSFLLNEMDELLKKA